METNAPSAARLGPKCTMVTTTDREKPAVNLGRTLAGIGRGRKTVSVVPLDA